MFEALESNYPNIKKVWLTQKGNQIEFPNYVVKKIGKLAQIYYYATSKVWINSHFFPEYVSKRKGQLSIFMYHGGIGIKRNSNEVPTREKTLIPRKSALNTSLAVSNSNFMDHVYRTSLEYDGPILKCGYPKNDPLFDSQYSHKKNVCDYYHITENKHIVLYAPTYRQDRNDVSNYNINLEKICGALTDKFGGDWIPIIRWHPHQSFLRNKTKEFFGNNAIDATYYGNMQELIIASDVFISDYSSCIFEAAERQIPCFSYAPDWESFKISQGVYFEIDRLPFPYSKNTEELIRQIMDYDDSIYKKELNDFMHKEGLTESGKASLEVANIISRYLNGENDILSKLDLIR